MKAEQFSRTMTALQAISKSALANVAGADTNTDKFIDEVKEALAIFYAGAQIDFMRERNANQLEAIKAKGLETPWDETARPFETIEDIQVKAMDLLQSGRINLFECLSVSQAPDLATAKVAFNSIKPRK